MARIALTVAGAVVGAVIGIATAGAGAPVGALVGAAIAGAGTGASVGRVVSSLVDPMNLLGPRLNDLVVSSSANGVVVPFGYGSFRIAGNIIWSPGLVENTQNSSAKGGPTSTTYNYYASFAAAFGQGPGQIVRVWGDTKVIFETGGPTYFPSKYFPGGSDGYWGGICGAFVDSYGNAIEAVWFGHGWTYTVPAGATALQLGINGNYQALASGGFPVNVSVAGGQSTTAYVPATAVPWEVVGAKNSSLPFGNVGGTAPVLVLQNLTAGQSVTVAAVPNGQGGYEGRITMNASVGVNALGNSTGVSVQWYGPDGDTSVSTGGTQTAPPASIYPIPTCYPGTEYQNPDPTIQANEGVENTPAFRGLVYAVWEYLPLANFGNRIPNIRAEVAYAGVVTPAPTSIVQSAEGSAGTSATLTLGVAPTVGNTLLCIGMSGISTPLTGPGGFSLLAHYECAENDGAVAVWSRVVQAGDGQSYTFTGGYSGGGGKNNFVLVECLGQPTITAAAGNAGNTNSTPVASNVLNVSGPALAFCAFASYYSGSPTSWEPSAFTSYQAFIEGGGLASASGSIPNVAVTAVYNTSVAGPVAYATVIVQFASLDSGGEVALASSGLDQICQDICLRSGLAASQIDVTRLAGKTVIGYVVGRLTTGQQALQPLALGYFFDAAEIDGVLAFIPRGQSSLMTIPELDLGLKEDDAEYTEEMGQEQDLPREIQVTYADPSIDYQQNKQAKRRSVKVVKTRSQTIMELPFAMETDTAAQVAERALYLAYLERRAFNINLWKAIYALLTPTDVIQFVGRGTTMQIRVVKTSEGAGGCVALNGVSEEPSAYLSQANGGVNLTYQGGAQASVLTVVLYLYDLPLLRDADANSAGTGLYFGLAAASGFAGAQLNTSLDNSNFVAEGPLVSATLSYGTALNTLGAIGNGSPAAAFSPWVLDTENTLHVQLVSGSFSNATLAQLTTQGVNAILVGNEVVQFETAAQQSDGSWILSGLLRGRRGTDNWCGSHVASETVILLNYAGLVRLDEPNTILNVLRYYRAVSVGQTLDAVSSSTFTVTGNDLKPWSPVAIGGSQDGAGDWTISWLRRTRFGGAYGTGNETLCDGVGGPVNEQTEQYQIDILGGSPLAVKRTLTVSTPTAVYTAAQQVADFGSVQSALQVNVYQMSAAVGRGFRGVGALPASTDAPVVLPSGGGAGQFYIN